ncbi:major capsid protein [Pseudomonas sp. FW306-02-F02-AA]|uniref:Capsid protein n=1 Tax=Pseudomonas fluorescens TaxID=294 RepID=A0A0N7H104_PSEFL|nr:MULTISPECIES: major capsid protein [Pseudomonas]ALI04588.1 capsid protein [Pseudomonas fluorescens]PMZ02345.1 major capsid protein [Pseudomonas sp. FW306-02-F02-AB]PMZ09062.1 major capsid protein [Pseudomonas sp. FW306-02-H06C]PMZ14774.1 major capsid protein [Pseudomonas sp. FW306-02-F02-AA]PMZ19480.1 major capsid protein [Pseudomonas sp. FW306-02-F08-AA]
MDIFDTRTMLEAVEQMPTARRFLMNTFFNGGSPVTFPTKTVDIDIIKGKRKMAPFVHPRLPGSVSLRDGYTTSNYTPPYIQPKRETTAELVLKRAAGDNPFSSRTPLERAGQLLGKDLRDLDDEIVRREEWMCAQALTTGKVRVIGEGVDDSIDFLMASDHKISLGSGQWGTADGDPIANLRGWKRKIAKDSGRTASTVAMSGEALDAFQSNATVIKQLNTRRVDMGLIKPEELPDGVTYLGYLNDPGVDLYGYDEWYLDDDDDEQPMIPAGGLILGSTSTRNAMLYGAIQDLEAVESGLVEAARFPKSWVTQEPSARWLKLQSAVLAGLLEPDAFIYAKVV